MSDRSALHGDIDWAQVVARLLRNETRPVALVTAKTADLIAASRPFERILGWTEGELAVGAWVEDCLTAAEHAHLRLRVSEASEGRSSSFALNLTTRSGAVAVNMAVEGVGGRSGAPVLCTILAVRETSALSPDTTAIGLHYVIKTADRDFGFLVRASDSPREPERPASGRRCYQLFYSRMDPCVGCPVLAMTDGEAHRRTVRRHPAGAKAGVTVLAARRLDPTTAVVSVVPLDTALLSAISDARLEEIAEDAQLSQRERDVFRYLLLGRSLADIANALSIAERTVKFHQRNLQRKLGAESRYDLCRVVL